MADSLEVKALRLAKTPSAFEISKIAERPLLRLLQEGGSL
jgi:hypothetical protein